jgi:hypothetical protein
MFPQNDKTNRKITFRRNLQKSMKKVDGKKSMKKVDGKKSMEKVDGKKSMEKSR